MSDATQIPAELVERRVQLVREMATPSNMTERARLYDRAKSLVAELPKPVDPDLLEARKIAVEILLSHDEQTGRPDSTKEWRKSIAAGTDDSHPVVQSTLAALKRGRLLESRGNTPLAEGESHG